MYKNNLFSLLSKIEYEEAVFDHILSKVPTYYQPFHLVTVKNGKKKTRHIDSPGKKSALALLQKRINDKLLVSEIAQLPECMVGSVKGKDLFKHIEPHVGQPTVVCMDLQHCFPNISQQRIFNTWNKTLGYNSELAKKLTQLTSLRGYLAQGPPTSPLLCNFILSKMANEISAVCAANGLVYTQYVDDICISGDDVLARAIIGEVHKIVKSHGQDIKDVKTEIMDSRHQQRSMGVVLNKDARLIKNYADSIADEIHAIKDRGLITTGEKLHLVGKILYLQKFNKQDAYRMRNLLNEALIELSQIDKKVPKKGNVRRCFHGLKNRFNNSRCQYL